MSTEIKQEGLWDARVAADFLKVKKATVLLWARQGRLPSVKVGGLIRFRPDDIRAVAEQGLPANEVA